MFMRFFIVANSLLSVGTLFLIILAVASEIGLPIS